MTASFSFNSICRNCKYICLQPREINFPNSLYLFLSQMSIKIVLKMVRICVFLLINAQICSFLNLTSMFIEDYTASILISDKSVRAIALALFTVTGTATEIRGFPCFTAKVQRTEARSSLPMISAFPRPFVSSLTREKSSSARSASMAARTHTSAPNSAPSSVAPKAGSWTVSF